jgi:thioredoxin-like negative regulator of GroEL
MFWISSGNRPRVDGKINSPETPGLAARFNITGVPTILVFRDGKTTDRVSGAMGKKFLDWWSRQLSI